MARDNSPVGYTCPLIDSVIRVLNDCECEYNSHDIQTAINDLEKVRSMNDELRDWGNGLFNQVKELQDEIEMLEG